MQSGEARKAAINKAREERRYRIVRLSHQDLLHFFHYSEYAAFSIRHLEVPSDAYIDDVHMDHWEKCWCVRVVHESFDTVIEGEKIPSLSVLGETIVRNIFPLVIKYPAGNCHAEETAKIHAANMSERLGREVFTMPDNLRLCSSNGEEIEGDDGKESPWITRIE